MQVEKELTAEYNVTSLFPLPNNCLAVGYFGHTSFVWDLSTNSQLSKLTPLNFNIDCLYQRALAKQIQGECTKELKEWDERVFNSIMQEEKFSLTLNLPLVNNQIATTPYRNYFRVREASSGKSKQTFEAHEDSVGCLMELSESKIVSGSYDKTIKVWDRVSGKCEMTLTGHTGTINSLLKLSETKIVSGSYDKTIKVWDLTKGTCEQTLQGHDGHVFKLIKISETKIVSFSFDKSIKVWDLTFGKCLQTIDNETNFSGKPAIAHLSQSEIAVGYKGRSVKIYRVNQV